MLQKFFKILSLIFILQLFTHGYAQNLTAADGAFTEDMVISYDIGIQTGSKRTSIAETYNGGSKTVFISKNKTRIRLVSLMRIESLFFLPGTDSTIHIFQSKESGSKNNPKQLSLSGWKTLNHKYDSAYYKPVAGESKEILGFSCKKAIIYLKDGRTITTYYTEAIKPLHSICEPAFACLPGLPLEYTYTYKSGSSTYTAVSIKKETIDPEIFLLKGKAPTHIRL
jgi:GLPGLI family protein